MKLCKNCSYIRLSRHENIAPTCYHHSAACSPIDFVFGHKVFYNCEAMRNSTAQNTCGTSAQYYEEISTGAKPQ